MTTASRYRLLPGAEGAAIRDLDKFARSLVRTQLIEFTEVYAEPMTLKVDPVPKALLVVNAEDVDLPETPVEFQSAASITRQAGGVRINKIFGLTVGTKYRFVMLAVG